MRPQGELSLYPLAVRSAHHRPLAKVSITLLWLPLTSQPSLPWFKQWSHIFAACIRAGGCWRVSVHHLEGLSPAAPWDSPIWELLLARQRKLTPVWSCQHQWSLTEGESCLLSLSPAPDPACREHWDLFSVCPPFIPARFSFFPFLFLEHMGAGLLVEIPWSYSCFIPGQFSRDGDPLISPLTPFPRS